MTLWRVCTLRVALTHDRSAISSPYDDRQLASGRSHAVQILAFFGRCMPVRAWYGML